MQDANWNVDALVDTSGAVVERFSYSAYGVPTFLNPDFTTKAASSYGWDVLYAGYKWDVESGMYQVRWRYLLPVVGNWLTRDPVQDLITSNNWLLGMEPTERMQLWLKYQYSLNNPINKFDSFGLRVIDEKTAATIASDLAQAPTQAELVKRLLFWAAATGLSAWEIIRISDCKREIDCRVLMPQLPACSQNTATVPEHTAWAFVLRDCPNSNYAIKSCYVIDTVPACPSTGLQYHCIVTANGVDLPEKVSVRCCECCTRGKKSTFRVDCSETIGAPVRNAHWSTRWGRPASCK